MSLKIIIKVVICLIIIVLGFSTWEYVHVPGRFPIKNVKIDGTYHYVSQKTLKNILLPEVSQGFFNIDVEQLQSKLAEIPGIKSASIRRSWPSTIHVKLIEYKAEAYWNHQSIVTKDGKVFKPNVMMNLPSLPSLNSNDVHAQLMLNTYEALEGVAKKDQYSIDDLNFTANQWSVVLSDHLTIILGSADPVKRFEKLLAILPEIQQQGKTITRIDMRYSNGFVVKSEKK